MFRIRPCDGCTACCVHMAVDSIGKPEGEPCKAIRPEGCAMYNKRPKDCKEFYCVWAQGQLPDDHRPDKLGILFYLVSPTDLSRDVRRRFDVDLWVAKEIIPGAFDNNDFLFRVLIPRHLIARRPLSGHNTYDGRSDVLAWISHHLSKKAGD